MRITEPVLLGAIVVGACAGPEREREVVAPAPTPAAVFRATGFERPESVLHDDARDRYLVSNLHGPAEGFISVLAPDGTITTPRWIEGGRDGVVLHEPKGLGIAGDRLYVADVDTVRTFAIDTGEPRGDIAIVGATFLNDIAVDHARGRVYVSDCGVQPAAGGGFEPSGSDAVWVIEGDEARPLAKTTALEMPNGLAVGPTGVWVLASAGGLYRLDGEGRMHDAIATPARTADGLVLDGDRVYLSDWDAKAIFTGPPAGPFTVAFAGIETPADIGLDRKRRRLLVPSIAGNAIEAHALPE